MPFYAHTRDDGNWQILKDHLCNVANLSRSHAEKFGAGQLGYLAGLLHDLGKYSNEFQARLKGSAKPVNHSTAGAQWIMDQANIKAHFERTGFNRHFALLIAFVISGHHGGLPNYGTIDEEGTLMCRLSNKGIPDFTSAWRELTVPGSSGSNVSEAFKSGLKATNLGWKFSFLGRMLYSCLVDADSIDTRDYCNPNEKELMASRQIPAMGQLLNRLHAYMSRFEQATDSHVNRKRQEILEACKRQSQNGRGLYSLSVPTGGGKTLASLTFALIHAVRHEEIRRIINVIPFTSIIEQSAERYREALGQESVLEHHSNFNFEEYKEHHGEADGRRLKLSTENWDAPVIVTTSVQFFESLFSNKRSKCRKLHNIAGSVIIIDEAQSIPRAFLKPCLHALQELVDVYGCTVVLCTATQPSWEALGFQPKEIMDNPTPLQLAADFKRVQVVVHGNEHTIVSDETVSDWMEASEQALCIVNTRRHAKLLLEKLQSRRMSGVYHLSGRMCAKHRTEILTIIKERLRDNLPCRVISTQLIEAGVDVDFPKVIRAYAGLDSIAQAAGRCNREGRREIGEVVVFYPEKHGMPSKGWMKETAVVAEQVLEYGDGNPLSLASIRKYFEQLHGILDNQVENVTDAEGIMLLLDDKRIRRTANSCLEIPYTDIAEKMRFIEENTVDLVVLYGEDLAALEWVNQLDASPNPVSILRKLQPYTVQIYHHELAEYRRLNLLGSKGGLLYLLDPVYYCSQAGLLPASEAAEHEVLIF